MPLPVSRTQFNKLGERLAAAEAVSDEDYELLKQALGAYEEAQLAVLRRLGELGFTATGRTKSTGTLIDKLRRHRTRLSTMQDLAGARLVVEGSRPAQDDAVAEIVRGFSTAGKAPEVDDRRSEPSSGYRAVHVIVTVDGLPVEIQVRTGLQDLWAQAYERLGDRWAGRSATAVSRMTPTLPPRQMSTHASPGPWSSATCRDSANR